VRNVPRIVTAAIAIVLAGCSAEKAAPPVAHAISDSLVVVPVTAADLAARVASDGARATIVNVWATWCVPCREEFPALLSVARSRAKDGVRLVLISADFPDQGPAIRAFLKAHGVTDTTYLKTGDDMSFINGLNPRWTGSLPATFVYSRGGKLSEFWEGRADSIRFTTALSKALAPSGS
jgi:thiol-disulfide isomerase/thioredoxin